MENQSVKTDMEQHRESETVEIDLVRLWNAVRKKIWVVLISVILCGAIALVGTVFLIAPKYQSSALLYVNNSVSLGSASVSVSYSDLTASKSLVDSYLVILNSRGTLLDVIDYAEVNRTYGELRGMISASAVNNTEIFQVVVTSTDPNEAEAIANAIAEVLPKRIASIIEGSSAKVVDYAIVPSVASSPSYSNNTILGVLVGFILSVGVIVLVELFDVTLKEEEDIKRCSNYPILASVTDMENAGKGGYYKKYKRYDTKAYAGSAQPSAVIGSGISFAASEAYKLLRTKIQYSFADEQKCRVIAVSSAMAGEGKSVSSANLANTLAQFGERVLLIDCDLRRPTAAEKLSLKKTPGLSEFLTGTMDINDLFQRYSSNQNDNLFYVITAGACPPNPVELLSSPKMAGLLKSLRGLFDYIIMDMPPIGEVSDALVAAKMADGVLMVVRQNYCNSVAFKDALRQFEFVNSRILGIVVNCAQNRGKSKYRDSHYAQDNKYYGKRYYKSSNHVYAEKSANTGKKK